MSFKSVISVIVANLSLCVPAESRYGYLIIGITMLVVVIMPTNVF